MLFDEFHERHITADLGLALTLDARAVLRTDLRIVVMSATLEATPVAALIGGAGGTEDASAAPVIVSEGRVFPVETRWRPPRDGVPLPLAVAAAVRAVCADRSIDGDVLVFLPGVAEIHRVRAALADDPPATAPEVLLLHGGLTLAEQDRVLRGGVARGDRSPGRAESRRIVLSTAIAESSVTLEGVRIVVDAGLARVPRFSARSGMTRLETTRVSRASADQRRGRAGRVAPGVCVRLWSEGTHAQLRARAVPEILEADLAPLALDLACAGVTDPSHLQWLDAPPEGAFAQARALLTDLGALDAAGRVTPHGRAMAALGVVPRLAHLVLTGAARGCASLACEIAALLGERDVLRREVAEFDADLRTRVELLRGHSDGRTADADHARLARARQEASALRRSLGDAATADDDDDLGHTGALVALAFPDRVAMRRSGEAPRYLLRNGRGARLATAQALGNSSFLAIADLDGDPSESRIWLAAPIDESELRAAVGSALVTEQTVAWDEATERVRALERERVGALVLRERPLRDVDPARVTEALLHRIRALGITALPWSDAEARLRARLAFAHRHAPDTFPDVSDSALNDSLEEWIGPALHGAHRLGDFSSADLGAALLTRLDWSARSALEHFAPTHLEVPSGSRIAIDYTDGDAPVLAVRLQEVFGLLETPRVAGGRVALTLHLLSPAHRPVQVTRDLANFWRTTYFEVRRDLKGRYPRHPWPDDPLSAAPTRRAKPRGT